MEPGTPNLNNITIEENQAYINLEVFEDELKRVLSIHEPAAVSAPVQGGAGSTSITDFAEGTFNAIINEPQHTETAIKSDKVVKNLNPTINTMGWSPEQHRMFINLSQVQQEKVHYYLLQLL